MKEDIQKALDTLKNGGVILYPTDTIWGLGCDATNPEAVQKIYDIKKRAEAKSLISLISTDAQLNRFVRDIPEVAWDLIDCATEPTTIIYPKAVKIADNATAEDGSVAIRMTQDEFCKQLIHKFNKPIISTSANISSQPSPNIFSDITEEVINAVDYVVNWRQEDDKNPKPSSIIKLGVNGEIKIIRK